MFALVVFLLAPAVVLSSSSSSSSSSSLASGRDEIKASVVGNAGDACRVRGKPLRYGGRVRSYFIKAEFETWDFAAGGKDFRGPEPEPFSEELEVFLKNSNKVDECRIGRQYRKARYVAYTDATFKTRSSIDVSLGLNGPVIRAVVGDRLEVHFHNALDFKASMHPHGVSYDKANEGTAGVEPGETFVYHWTADEASGPASDDVSSTAWGYHSHVNSVEHINAGLFGHLVVTSPVCADAQTGAPLDVQREFFVTYLINDENAVPASLLEHNIANYCDRFGGDLDELKADEAFVESNLKHAINGRLAGNLPGLVTRIGERVRWYIVGWGNEFDVHTAHWHGQTVVVDHRRVDTIPLLPATFAVADMIPRTVGRWQHHCHVADHISAGMTINYRVVAQETTDAELAATPVDAEFRE